MGILEQQTCAVLSVFIALESLLHFLFDSVELYCYSIESINM